MEKVKYTLSAMRLTDKNISDAINHRFHRVTSNGYGLIYSDKGTPDYAVEITEEHIDSLSASDMEWLQACNKIVIQEYVAAHSASAQDGFLKDLEAQIQEQIGGKQTNE